jgi:hypothetical protein
MLVAMLLPPANVVARTSQRPAFVAASVRPSGGARRPDVTAADRGREIALEADRRDRGWGDAQAALRMVLRNGQGEESMLALRAKKLESVDEGEKLLLLLEHPADRRNAALLSVSRPGGAGDLWLYLPASDRVERVATNDRSSPFMGSEFAYEDLVAPRVAEYEYAWLRDETVDGFELFVVERRPVNESSGYTRQVLWIDKHEYRLWKVDSYDRKGDLIKTLRYLGYRAYLDAYWRPGLMHMVNHETGASTTLEWTDYEFRTGLSERDFDRNSLPRRR